MFPDLSFQNQCHFQLLEFGTMSINVTFKRFQFVRAESSINLLRKSVFNKT